jgi:prolyl oligopeptidase
MLSNDYRFIGLSFFITSSFSFLFVLKKLKSIRLVQTLHKSVTEKTHDVGTANVSDIHNYWLSRDRENDFLESVLGEDALDWVKEKNKKCLEILGNPEKSPMYSRILNILDSKDKIPYVNKCGNYLYNFWQDSRNKKGLLRKTTFESYEKSEIDWISVLDIDALAESENENWVYKGYSLLDPEVDSEEPTRILVHLSRGGADATVVREFDLIEMKFLPDEFYLPEAKSRVAWKTKDILLVGTDVHDGKSLTDSGYPRVVREWKRGTSIQDAEVLFEGKNINVFFLFRLV